MARGPRVRRTAAALHAQGIYLATLNAQRADNALTLDYGERGRAAVRRFLGEAWDRRLIPAPVEVEFLG